MHDLENAEFGKSTIGHPRSCFYHLLIRLINKFIEKRPSLLPECKATRAYELTMSFCRSVRSPYWIILCCKLVISQRRMLTPPWRLILPKKNCFCQWSVFSYTCLYMLFCIKIKLNTLLDLMAIQARFWVNECTENIGSSYFHATVMSLQKVNIVGEAI